MCTIRTFGQGTELPFNLSSSVDVTPRNAVTIRVPEREKEGRDNL